MYHKQQGKAIYHAAHRARKRGTTIKNTTANTWTFATTSATVNGRTFPASYSLARSGDVYVFTALRAADGTDMPVRIHVTADMPMHADAVAAAKAARDADPAAAVKAEPTIAAPAQDAAQTVAKPWIGTTITGKGWNIAFDEQAQRTRVLFQVQPTAAQKAAIENAGFFWSNQLQSWNKKLTCKAHRAAQELAAALNALA